MNLCIVIIMPPKAGIKGKQPSVQEGSFLQFLRSVGYKEELPPSTVAWLEDAPVFKFLASRLSSENFVSVEDQQEYNEIMLAQGPNPELYEALGDSGSDDEVVVEQQRTDEQSLEEIGNPVELQQHVQVSPSRACFDIWFTQYAAVFLARLLVTHARLRSTETFLHQVVGSTFHSC